jgi:molybdopterin molybdotransferase
MRLASIDNLLQPLLGTVTAVTPISLPADRALGFHLAADVAARAQSPATAVALRAGLAVRSLDLVGASPQTPVILLERPRLVQSGESLPPGCDAIIDAAAVTQSGALVEAMEAVEPGSHVRLAGHDLGHGQLVGTAGMRVTTEFALVARLAGLIELDVRRPACALDWPEGAQKRWLADRLHAAGVHVVGPADAADMIIASAADDAPRLALRPGETGWALMRDDGVISVALPKRFDGMLGAWCALVLPLLARFIDVELALEPLALDRKLVSTVGLTEVALVCHIEGRAQLLAVGDLTMAALASADAFALVAPGSEGAAAGDVIDVVPLDQPFRARTKT